MKGDFSKTYSPFGIKNKKEITDLLLFFAKIDEIQMLVTEDLELLRLGFYNIISALYNEDLLKSYKKLNDVLKKEIENMEKEIKIDKFVDFSKANEEVKKLNILRIRIREAEALFYKIKEFEDKKYDVIKEFLNLASKYLFYYILKNYKDLEYWIPKEEMEKLKRYTP